VLVRRAAQGELTGHCSQSGARRGGRGAPLSHVLSTTAAVQDRSPPLFCSPGTRPHHLPPRTQTAGTSAAAPIDGLGDRLLTIVKAGPSKPPTSGSAHVGVAYAAASVIEPGQSACVRGWGWRSKQNSKTQGRCGVHRVWCKIAGRVGREVWGRDGAPVGNNK
jgi:hypothetical protein